MQTNTPRIAISDRQVALTKGRTIADVRVELDAGHNALSPVIRSRQMRDALARAADVYDDYLMRTA